MDPRPSLPPGARPRIDWRRLTRSPRGAAGVTIAAAALLLWPFAGLSWIPWLVGLGVLALIHLVRFDGLLRGWAPHVAGLAVVVGLMMSSGPWAWALALSIGVLLAGLAQLPWWRLAAVGAVLCVISGTGFAFATWESRQELLNRQAEASEHSFSLVGERRPDRVLGALLEGIGQGDVPGVCGLLDERARGEFMRAAKVEDCASAVGHFRGAVGAAPRYDHLDMTAAQQGDTWLIDGCRTVWAKEPLGGPSMGRLEVRKSPPPGEKYFVGAFLAC